MSKDQVHTVLCHYAVIAERESEFRSLLAQHWPTLRKLDLVTDEPSQIYRIVDGEGRPLILEIFHWKSDDAVRMAHEHPDVQAVWEPMMPLCEGRNGMPSMQFPQAERLELG
jgi:hypothetical protein